MRFRFFWLITTFVVITGFVLVLVLPRHAKAATPYCYCETTVDSALNNKVDQPNGAKCFPVQNGQKCTAQDFSLDANMYTCDPVLRDDQTACEASQQRWNEQFLSAQNTHSSGSGIIPSCLMADQLSKNCRDIKIFVVLLINASRYVFSIVGALALAVFVYGGFMLIISAGNPESVKKGTDAMIAAVIGLVIVFTAYILVNFVGDVVGVKTNFNLLTSQTYV